MGKKHPDTAAAVKSGQVPTAAGRKAATNALREEAERSWAESDRKAMTGRGRTQARAGRRRVARERDAEIALLRGKLARAERDKGRKAE